jgi:hypothetical protein
MSWASKRETTRVEDLAYCLLGIFGVQMPLLYGEGPNAFRRLQEEIAKKSPDLSLLAWRSKSGFPKYLGVLAPSVQCFENISFQPMVSEFTVTNFGLKIPSRALLNLRSDDFHSGESNYFLRLGRINDSTDLYLVFIRVDSDTFVRSDKFGGLMEEGKFEASRITGAEFYLELDPMQRDVEERLETMRRWIRFDSYDNLQLIQVHPQTNWDWSSQALNPSNTSAVMFSYGACDTPMIFLVLCLEWQYMEDVFVIDYSNPATQYIIHNLENLYEHELVHHWKLSPAKSAPSEVENQQCFLHTLDVEGGQLTVNISATIDPESSKVNFGLISTSQIAISCSFQGQ